MSGTGVQSAMRRRTRPPEDQRRDISRQNRNTNIQSNTPSNNNQPQSKPLNIQQVIYMQEMKLQNITKRLETLGINTNIEKTDSNEAIKAEIEENINKKISLLNNNLNFILNGLNDERSKINTLNIEIDKLRANSKVMLEKLETKLDYNEFIEFKTKLDNNTQITSENTDNKENDSNVDDSINDSVDMDSTKDNSVENNINITVLEDIDDNQDIKDIGDVEDNQDVKDNKEDNDFDNQKTKIIDPTINLE